MSLIIVISNHGTLETVSRCCSISEQILNSTSYTVPTAPELTLTLLTFCNNSYKPELN